MKYFKLNDDVNVPGRWYLGEVYEVDNWQLLSSLPPQHSGYSLELVRDGSEMDFTFSEIYGLPIVSRRAKDVLDDIDGLAFIPVEVKGKKCSSSYFVLVIEKTIECVDEVRSEFEMFEKDDPVRPDLAGSFSGFFCLKVDSNKIMGEDFFRIKRHEISVIVSQRVKNRLESIGATGMYFSDVT